MRARPVVLLVIAAGAVVAVATAVARDDGRSTRVSNATVTTSRPATTAPPTTAAPTTTTLAPTSEATAEAIASEVYAYDDEVPGLVITNSGSATADVGGNVVSGGSDGAGTIVTGDATAVGNTASVRAP